MKRAPAMEYEPQEILAKGTLIKSNPVRKVLRLGDLYLKLDIRPGSSFRREFCGAQLLARAGLPVAEHLAFGTIPEGSYLVTRAWGDGSTVMDHVESCGADGEFLAGLAVFLNRFYASRLWHGDLHGGNILYRKETGEFAFVDVRAVSFSPIRRLLFGERLRHLAMDLRSFLPLPRLLRFAAELGISDPGAWFRRNLEADVRRIRRQWPRRKEQIFAGYPKFTVREGERLWSVPRTSAGEDAAGELFSGAEAERIFLAHFYLQLMQIPHRRALWFDSGSRTVALEVLSAAPGIPLSDPELADWQARLRQIGSDSGPSDWERRGDRVFYRETAGFAERLPAADKAK